MLLPVNRNQNGTGPIVSLVMLGLCVVLLGGVFTNRDRLTDWWRLRGYTPSATVVSLADQTTMTPYARHMFYINRPQTFSSIPAFRQNCPENQDTIVLGCYHSGENGIYLYQVPDASLAGVEQVTAAHEMLHAAYGRLSASDRATLDGQLEAYYAHGLTDTQVKAQIKVYQANEPTAMHDEMDSLFGTEIAQLPAPLETYYARYFSDRTKVVAYDQQYQGQFTARQATIAADDARLAADKTIIDSEETSLKAQLAQITADRTRINSYAAGNDTERYNAAVPGFNDEVSAYNADITKLRADSDAYNQLVTERNQIARQLATLDKALDTRTATQISH